MDLPEDVVYLALYKRHHGCEIAASHHRFNIHSLDLQPEKQDRFTCQMKQNGVKVVHKCKNRFHAIVKRKHEPDFQYLFLKEGYYMGLLVKHCLNEMEIDLEEEDFLRLYIHSQMTNDKNDMEIETEREIDGFLVEKKVFEISKEADAPATTNCCVIL